MKKSWAALAVMLLCAAPVGAAMPTFVDTSGLLTAQDKQVIQSIIEHYATGSRLLAERMDDAEDAIEDYLERQYGDDVYDVYTKFRRGADERVLLVAERQTMRLDPHHAFSGERLTDVTGSLTSADRSRIEEILAEVTARGAGIDAAEDAVEQYLDDRYGHDFYEVDIVRSADGYRLLITAD